MWLFCNQTLLGMFCVREWSKSKGESGLEQSGVGQQVASLHKGVGHPIFEPLERAGHDSFRLNLNIKSFQR